MARLVTPLTDVKINKSKPQLKDYKLFDGGGLFLLIKSNGIKCWRHKFRKPDGKETTISYGDYPTVSLKNAREQREATKLLLSKNINPADERRNQSERLKADDIFSSIANSWLQHTAQHKKWVTSYKEDNISLLDRYLLPTLGKKTIENVTTQELVKVIELLVTSGKIYSAKRMRQFIIGIFNYATLKGLIENNPAFALTALMIENKTTHRAVIKLQQLPKLITDIQDNTTCDPVIKLALLINLHLFMRASELVYARWDEINLDTKLWTLPESRQPIKGREETTRGAKMKTPHIIPLSEQAIALIKQLKPFTYSSGLVFTTNMQTPISNIIPNNALRNIGYGREELTLHGFRTLVCSALIESGLFTKDAIERQMSHIERNNVRAAYIHNAQHLTERRALMNWWSDYITYITENHYIEPYNFKGRLNNR